MHSYPEVVNGSAVRDFLKAIKLDPVDLETVRSIHVDTENMTIVRIRRGAAGGIIVINGEPVEESVKIPIRWSR